MNIIRNLEKNIIRRIEQKKDVFFFLIITILGVMIRIPGHNFISKDMDVYLNPWFNTIKNLGGLSSLSMQVGDYNILYQTIIAFLTYIDADSTTMYKLVSCIFDFLLAYYGAVFICELSFKTKYGFIFNCSYFMILFFPTIIFNSSFWGQCDGIYTFFCILTLRNLYKEKYRTAFFFLGIAFAFKLQTIFFVPFIICYYFYKNSFTIFYLGISALVFELSGIFAFLAGRSLKAPWEIYANQVAMPVLYANIANFWPLIWNNYEWLNQFAIILTICVLGFGLYIILSKKKDLSSSEGFLNFACWTVWTCIFFLPVMHDRYVYGLDILLLILCFINKIYIPFVIISEILSLLSYSNFLFDAGYLGRTASVIFFAAYLSYTCMIFLYQKKSIERVEKTE